MTGGAITPFQEQLLKRAGAAADDAANLWIQEGYRGSLGTQRVRVARHIATNNGRAWNIGALSFNVEAVDLTGVHGSMSDVTVDRHFLDIHRLNRGLVTITDDETSLAAIAQRIHRLALAEFAEAAQKGYAAALKKDRRIQGWTRGLEADACQLCVWWWRDGRVWPKEWPLQRHKGCMCVQVLTTQPAQDVDRSTRLELLGR